MNIIVYMISFFNISVLEIGCQEIVYYASKNEIPNPIHETRSKHNYLNDESRKIVHEKYKTKSQLDDITVYKREADTVFHGHPKTQEEIWEHNFIGEDLVYDQTPSLIKLLHMITYKHMNSCTPVVLYDTQVETGERLLLQGLFANFPLAYTHGSINEDNTIAVPDMIVPVTKCLNYIVFLADVMRCGEVIGLQARRKVVVVARSSQWRVQEFLSSEVSRKFVNLLVIGQSFKDDDDKLEATYILYTHKLYTDGLGTSQPRVLTSWTRGKLTRPEVKLFPKKMTHGYAGHRFLVAAGNQPPYVFRRVITDADGGNPRITWDGMEYRVLEQLAVKYNFSIEISEPRYSNLGSGDAVALEVTTRRAAMGIGGLYLTAERLQNMDMSNAHSEDCAVFVSLTSTALPRYRAIMGPFHWQVWLAMTFTYLIGIFPLAFSDKHTLRHLLHNGGEVENMFWYMFGTFTNCFTFVGKNSWSKTTKITTRLLIGWYWIFTIIITSCYTGSIIAFVTLPVFPTTIDSIKQLLNGFYRIGTLDRGGWEKWFLNSSDPQTNKLFKKIELVPDIESGLRNTTKAFFWPYAFLGSRTQLEYIVQSNFSMSSSKRSVLHISRECFVPFGVAIAFPNQSLYSEKLSKGIQRLVEGGLILKINNEVKWEMQRSATGKLLSAGSGNLRSPLTAEKGLTLDDTQGMFLLLGAGFLIAASALLSEWMGGCSNKCKRDQKKKDLRPRTDSSRMLIPTPNSHITDDIFFIDDRKDSFTSSGVRKYSLRRHSNDTLDGEIIQVTKANIDIHNNVLLIDNGRRRSSSIEVEKEIDKMFNTPRESALLGSEITISEENHQIKGDVIAFGDKVQTL